MITFPVSYLVATNQSSKRATRKKTDERGAKKRQKVFENRFRSRGEENERRMENNVMQGRRVYDG